MDTFLTAIVGFTQLVLAVMGIVMALSPPKQEKHWRWVCAFIAVGLLGVIATVWLSVRASRAQEQANSKLTALGQREDEIWGELNQNPIKTEARTQPSEQNPPPRKAVKTPKNPPPKTQHKPTTPLPEPENPPSYFGSVSHVNFPPSNGALTIASQNAITSTRADAPYQTEFIVQSTVVWPTIKLALECNRDLVAGEASLSSGGVMFSTSQGLANGHPNIFVFQYASAAPTFGPAYPLKIDIWSKEPVSCTEITTF